MNADHLQWLITFHSNKTEANLVDAKKRSSSPAPLPKSVRRVSQNVVRVKNKVSSVVHSLTHKTTRLQNEFITSQLSDKSDTEDVFPSQTFNASTNKMSVMKAARRFRVKHKKVNVDHIPFSSLATRSQIDLISNSHHTIEVPPTHHEFIPTHKNTNLHHGGRDDMKFDNENDDIQIMLNSSSGSIPDMVAMNSINQYQNPPNNSNNNIEIIQQLLKVAKDDLMKVKERVRMLTYLSNSLISTSTHPVLDDGNNNLGDSRQTVDNDESKSTSSKKGGATTTTSMFSWLYK